MEIVYGRPPKHIFVDNIPCMKYLDAGKTVNLAYVSLFLVFSLQFTCSICSRHELILQEMIIHQAPYSFVGNCNPFTVKALNEIKASLGWRVVYAWVGDDPCGDGDLPPWTGVTCSQQGDYRVVTEL